MILSMRLQPAKGAIIGSAFIKYLKTNGTQNIDKFIETITSK